MLLEQDGITTATFRATGWLRIVGSLVGLGDGLFPLLIIDGVLGLFAYNVIRGDLEDWLSPVVPRSMNGLLGGFLALLFVTWTIKLMSALRDLLHSGGGIDKLTITPDHWIITGTWTIRRIPRQRVFDLYVGPFDGSPLILDTDERRHVITSLGTPDERLDAVQRLRPIIPERSIDDLRPLWTIAKDPDGTFHVALRRFDRPERFALILLLTLGALALTMKLAGQAPAAIIVPIGVLAIYGIALSLWTGFSRRDWIVRHDFFASRVRCFRWSRTKIYDRQSLKADRFYSGNEGPFFGLLGTVKGKQSVVYRAIAEDHDVIRLARFVEANTGWPIPIPVAPDTSKEKLSGARSSRPSARATKRPRATNNRFQPRLRRTIAKR
jgi:hypothetical protein